jgi:bacterioferritin
MTGFWSGWVPDRGRRIHLEAPGPGAAWERRAPEPAPEDGLARIVARTVHPERGRVDGSLEFRAEGEYLQPEQEQTGIVHVIEAETGAINHYNKLIEVCDGADWATQEMVIASLRDEEGHLRLFEGFLREFEIEGRA